MLGIYRFFLASLVVFFHFGGADWLVGRLCVVLFYMLSGFLIFNVIENFYVKHTFGIPLFLLNRFLRLVPLYCAIHVLTIFFVRHIGLEGYLFEGERKAFYLLSPDAFTSTKFNLLEALIPTPKLIIEKIPYLTFYIPTIPQAWSVGVEECFYLTAIFITIWPRKIKAILFWLYLLLSLTLFFIWPIIFNADFDWFDQYLYRNYFATLGFFLSGHVLLDIARSQLFGKIKPKLRFVLHCASCVLILAFLVYVSYFVRIAQSPENFMRYVLYGVGLCIMALSLYRFSKESASYFSRIDEFLGKLTYGVYINHFLACLICLKLNNDFEFGLRINRVSFGFFAWGMSILLAVLFYVILEIPFERLREALKRAITSKKLILPIAASNKAQIEAN